MIAQLAAIGAGATLGAWLRWGLALALNAWVPRWPLGTLAANLIGGYLVGVAAGYLLLHPGVSPLWRLTLVTGFLGGLTTFSTFSAEVVTLLQQHDYLGAAILACVHLAGSLLLTLAGFATVKALAT